MRQICTRRAEALKEAAYLAAACARATAAGAARARGWLAGSNQSEQAARRGPVARAVAPWCLVWSSRVMTSLTNATPCVGQMILILLFMFEIAKPPETHRHRATRCARPRSLARSLEASRFLAAEIRPPPPRPRLASSASRCQIRRAARMPQIRTAPTIRLPEDWQRKPCWRHQCLLLPQARLS